jgi:hypothetical protein
MSPATPAIWQSITIMVENFVISISAAYLLILKKGKNDILLVVLTSE